MTQYFFRDDGETEMIQLTSDIINSDTCDNILNLELQGFTIPPKSRFRRTMNGSVLTSDAGGTGTSQYWIYSLTYNLLDNTINIPLQDGGQTAVELTKDPPLESILDNGKSPFQDHSLMKIQDVNFQM
jgi:hypothetical protein